MYSKDKVNRKGNYSKAWGKEEKTKNGGRQGNGTNDKEKKEEWEENESINRIWKLDLLIPFDGGL